MCVTVAPPEPSTADIDQVMHSLKESWTATITVRRQSWDDLGYREIFVSLDGESIAILRHGEEVTRDVVPGRHQLRAHNTLFWKTLDINLSVGEHANFVAVNRAGFLTYSVLAFFMGGGPIYLTFERQPQGTGDGS